MILETQSSFFTDSKFFIYLQNKTIGYSNIKKTKKMYKIKFYDTNENFEEIHLINSDVPFNKVFESLGLDSDYIFFRNIMRESTESQWNILNDHDKYVEMFKVSYLSRNEYTIDIIALGNKKTNSLFYDKEFSEIEKKIIDIFKRFKFNFCIKNLLKNIKFVYNLFYNFDDFKKKIDECTGDEIYYISLYYMFQIDYDRKFFFERESGHEKEICFSQKRNNSFDCFVFEKMTEKLIRMEPNDFRGFFLIGYYHVNKTPSIDKKIAKLYLKEAIKRGDFEDSFYYLYKIYHSDFRTGISKYENELNYFHELGFKIRNFKMINLCAYFYYQNNDKKKAIKIYEKAISNGSINALWKISFYIHSETNKDNEKIVNNYKKVSEYNKPIGYHCLGFHYEKLEKNYKKMEKYYISSIKNFDYGPSLINLAAYYYDNNIKTELSCEYMERAVRKGSATAMFNYAIFMSLKKNENKTKNVIRFYEKAYENGQFNAGYKLGTYYWNLKKIDLMEKTFLRSVKEKKCALCMTELGKYYFTDHDDKAKALILFKKAALQNNSEAFFCIGEIYRIKKQYDLMEINYKLSIKHGNYLHAIENLAAYCYIARKPIYFNYYISAILKKSERSLNEFHNIFLGKYKEGLLLPENPKILKGPEQIGKIIEKLNFLIKNKKQFESYDYRNFIVSYYIFEEKDKGISHLKKYCINYSESLLKFQEYKDYREKKFMENLQKTFSKDVGFKFNISPK